jgi:conjugal transfer pilus assembly protein TraL
MNHDDYWIPRNLDAPPLFFLWEADTALLFVAAVLLGALFGSFLFGVVLAVLAVRGYRRLKEEGGRGLIVRLLYWYTPSESWVSHHLPSHVREYYGG